MPLLEVKDLSKRFVVGRSFLAKSAVVTAVRNVSFDLNERETLAIVGESGSGKSTTGRLVLRLLEPDGGNLCFEGTDLRTLDRGGLHRMRRRMQVIFQDPYASFNPKVTLGESIGEPLKVHFGMDRKRRLAIVGQLMERVGMRASELDRFPKEFSGGQLQRASIARALTLKPQMIVCDECVAALDVSIRAQVLNVLEGLQRELGVSYLFITHDLTTVRSMAHRVLIMRAGEIVESGSVAGVFANPRHAYTRELLAAAPKLTTKQDPSKVA